MRALLARAGFATALLAAPAAADPSSCRTVRFADVGWTDITATTALASRLLAGLGYAPRTEILSVPVTYASLGARNVDVFLGNWMPNMEADRKPYLDGGAIEVIGPNLTGARYTFAVPEFLYEAGLRSFSDIARFRSQLRGKIYGIEAGNDGNRAILSLIDRDAYGLGSFDLVESSEQGMLAQVERLIRRREAILFLGWEPHPMNTKFKIRYLSGGGDAFGPNGGDAEIFTNLRAGLAAQCPNLGHLFRNLTFDLPTENAVMGSILFDGLAAEAAAEAWLKANPDAWRRWLDGVETLDGRPGLDAVRAALGLS